MFDNSNLFYSVKGQGEPLVFIHGNFNDSRIWSYQIDKFSKYYKVICYDLRGYGKSDTPTSSFSHFEDLKSLLDLLGIKKVIIVGSSLGGSVAIDFALQYPEYVKSLVLAAPAINGYRYPLRLMIEAIKSILLIDIDSTSSVEVSVLIRLNFPQKIEGYPFKLGFPSIFMLLSYFKLSNLSLS